jgi:hypothetical protein
VIDVVKHDGVWTKPLAPRFGEVVPVGDLDKLLKRLLRCGSPTAGSCHQSHQVGRAEYLKIARGHVRDGVAKHDLVSKAAPTDWRAVPSVSADFGVASADIKRRVEALIDDLAKE